jgi:hypothetical protein
MKAMLGISLYSYLYLKLAKPLCLSYYRLCFFFNIIREEGRTGSARKQGEGRMNREVAQTMYTYISKCKNDKIKERKKKKLGAAEHQLLVPCTIIDVAPLSKGTKMGCEP